MLSFRERTKNVKLRFIWRNICNATVLYCCFEWCVNRMWKIIKSEKRWPLTMIGCSIWEIEWMFFFFSSTVTAMIKKSLEIEELRCYFWIMIMGAHHDTFLWRQLFEWNGQKKTLINLVGQLKCKSKYNNIWWMAQPAIQWIVCIYPYANHQM